jgi:hypothetical protein
MAVVCCSVDDGRAGEVARGAAPPQAIFATVNGSVAVGGIDRPPPIIGETDAEWLVRRRAELAQIAADGAARCDPAPALAAASSPAHEPGNEAAEIDPAPRLYTPPPREMSAEQERWLAQRRRELGVGNVTDPNPEQRRR